MRTLLKTCSKRAALLCAAACLLFSRGPAAAAPAAGEKLNVIIVSLDLLRADRLAAYGGGRNLAPNLDAFAGTAAVYLNAVSASGWTLPSAVSVFTGLYPLQHKISNIVSKTGQGGMERSRLAPGILTLAEVFKRRGYETASFAGGTAIWHNFGLERGFDLLRTDTSQKLAASFAQAQTWLQQRKGGKPFFAFIQGFDLLHWQNSPGPGAGGNGGPAAAAPSAADRVAAYDERVKAADLAFGEFLAALEKMGLRKKTVIVFLSHHGEGLGLDAHGPPLHAMSLYEEFIRVPLLIGRPGAAPAAIKRQVSLLDVGPTVLAAAGLGEDKKFAEQTRRKPLYPFGAGEDGCRSAFSEIEAMYLTELVSLRACSGWKLIYDFKNSTRQLYDLNKDPGEKKDVYAMEPEIAGRLEEELFDWLGQ
ncbi:MAG TPA: sulfatase [Elusimicrobiales bacterium]|nr:sulfatase [Elusimicrobiales bacterium]